VRDDPTDRDDTHRLTTTTHATTTTHVTTIEVIAATHTASSHEIRDATGRRHRRWARRKLHRGRSSHHRMAKRGPPLSAPSVPVSDSMFAFVRSLERVRFRAAFRLEWRSLELLTDRLSLLRRPFAETLSLSRRR